MTEAATGSLVLSIVLALLVASAIPRLVDLDRLAFYGDEETMSMPARALASGDGSQMPSGMPYRRALPLTWLNALSARLLGAEQELSYRLPAALLSLITIPVLFLLLWPLLGVPTAAVAALLLALSEWHVITSREARMYGPLLLCYTVAVIAGWRWLLDGRWTWLLATVGFFLAATSLHVLALPAVAVMLIPLLVARKTRVSWPTGMVVAAALAVLALLYRRFVVREPVIQWRRNFDRPFESSGGSDLIDPGLIGALGGAEWVLITAGAAVGIWLGITLVRTVPGERSALWIAAILALGTAAGAFSLLGQLHGAAWSLVGLALLHPTNALAMLRAAPAQALIIGCAAVAWIAYATITGGLVEGLQSLLMYPFPYFAYFVQMFPIVTAGFVATLIGLAITGFDPDEPQVLRCCALAAIAPPFAVGILLDWGGARYIIAAQPFVLIVTAAGLIIALGYLARRLTIDHPAVAPLVATILIAVGVDPGHGFPSVAKAVRADYGARLDELALGYPVYPDHAAPGGFVREHARDEDIIVAEDALQQYWYAGRVDLWLRDPRRTAQFLILREDGLYHDVYVDSISMTGQVMDELLIERSRCIWVITSGETEGRREKYLDRRQLEWLKAVMMANEPIIVGRDGISRVYLLNCPLRPSGGTPISDLSHAAQAPNRL